MRRWKPMQKIVHFQAVIVCDNLQVCEGLVFTIHFVGVIYGNIPNFHNLNIF